MVTDQELARLAQRSFDLPIHVYGEADRLADDPEYRLGPDGHLVLGVPNDVYHADTTAVSATGLKQVLQSPAHYKASQEHPRPQSRAMMIGTAIHTAILEPSVFEKHWLLLPDITDRRRKEYKDAVADTVIQPDNILVGREVEHVVGMAEAIRDQHVVKALLNLVHHTEVTVLSDMAVPIGDDVKVKMKADVITNNGMIIDLKKTQDARPAAFRRSVAAYQYNVQAAFYRDVYSSAFGMDPAGVYFLAVEESPPHGVMLYTLSDEDMMIGTALYQKALAHYAHCLKQGLWPGYDVEPLILRLSGWARSEQEAMLETERDEDD